VAGDEPPEDLVALKVAFWAADAECTALGERPAAPDSAGRERQAAQLNAALFKRARITAEMYRHSWWEEQPNRYEADQAVIRAARARTA
jgi:hypothetical protein